MDGKIYMMDDLYVIDISFPCLFAQFHFSILMFIHTARSRQQTDTPRSGSVVTLLSLIQSN